eukprot:TRINITY_DN2074_c0_g1_i1.p1 TRINITY_DN2074_c0_g1~~TRINITY_DN2074_c0_g1_i1.p1  ORF type:complete len:684 (-),score=225.62 TRINITY_DN2074_c0_g1_i1:92-1897(-)
MRDFLLEDGMIEILFGFVSRLDEVPQPQPGPPKKRDLNPSNNEDPVRRSFNVMGLFVDPMNDLDDVLGERMDPLIHELFNVFTPNSSGNFYHANKIMEQLLLKAPVETTAALVGSGLLWRALDYTNEAPVVDMLIEVFCCSFPKQSDIITFYKSLVEAKMFDRIGEKICTPGNPLSPHVAECFIRLIEKLSSFEMSGILFISLCRMPAFIDSLFKLIVSDDPKVFLAQRQAAASVLRELLIRSGEKMFEHPEFARPMPNMLSAVHDKLHEHAKGHVTNVANVLIHMDATQRKDKEIKYSAYVVKRPFGMYRFALVEILADLIVCQPALLTNLPPQIWKVLSGWFLEYRQNNLYHIQFYKIFQVVIRENNEEALKLLLQDAKFLFKMIEQYRSEELSCVRGFVILIANTLRLTADLQPATAFLKHYLISHSTWKEFLPVLRQDTEVQLRRYQDITPEMIEDEDDQGLDDLDIDIGSAYAKSLGFEEESLPSPATDAPKKKNKKKNKKKKSKKVTNASVPTGPNMMSPHHTTVGERLLENIEQKEESKESTSGASNEEWWQSMKSELAAEDGKKTVQDVKAETGSADSNEWWGSLKQELEEMQ